MGPDREPSGEPSLAAGHGAAVCAAGGPAPRRVVPHDEGGLLPAVAGEPGSVGCVRHCVRFPSGLHQRRPMKPLLRILLLAFGGLLAARSGASLADRRLDIYWIDVEGGGATLIVTPAGESILIDAGWNLDRDAARIHDVATKVAGIHEIDYFIATHWHADHYGGAIKLSQRIHIKKFYANGPYPDNVADDPAFPTLMPQY